MSLKERLKHGYTLTELVIVMIVIAAIVGVSIKITKAKLDSAISYMYYSAYTTLQSVAGEMIASARGSAKPINAMGRCDIGYTFFPGNELAKQCVMTDPKLPSNGRERLFCNQFAGLLNINGGISCNTLHRDLADVSELTPNFISRNGMRFYGVSNGLGMVSNLNGTGAYYILIDLDGNRGESIKGEDVFGFYMTMTGKVIPEYTRGKEIGPNSTAHLSVSVSYDDYSSGNRVPTWLAKSVTFREAACISGYIDSSWTYCTDPPQIRYNGACDQNGADCRLIINKPLKFF